MDIAFILKKKKVQSQIAMLFPVWQGGNRNR